MAFPTPHQKRVLQFPLKSVFCSIAVFGISLALLLRLGSTPGGRILFSPDTLETKFQCERLLLWTDIPVTRSHYESCESQLVAFLVELGYWSPSRVKKPRWHRIYHWNEQWRDGHTTFYAEVIRRSEYWMSWSEQNPELAAVVWPRVLESLRDPNHAVALEESCLILRHADSANDPEDFEDRIASDPLFGELQRLLGF